MSTYQVEALKTLAPSESKYIDATHAGFGFMTEVGEILDTYKRHRFYKVELDKKNLIEEVGDVLWYIALAYHAMGKEMPEVPTTVAEEGVVVPLNMLLAKLGHYAANFFSITLTWEHSWEDNYLEYDLNQLHKFLAHFTKQELGVDISEAAQANIMKLSKRYPNLTFSVQDALNRDTENELSHINSRPPTEQE
jgi:NTP pyrophosphatase (non-canonical NTP hydrolase)